MKKNPTIFLIDDDLDDQEIFSIALESADVKTNCIFANDGIHALEKINTDASLIPDVIFIDMNMPRMNGQQCLAEIKKIDRLKKVPVYMYSTSADPSSIAENKKLGAEDFILKPSDINLLTITLSNIIRKRVLPFMVCLFFMSFLPGKGFSQKDTLAQAKELKKLTVEQLMNIVVTSVSKTPEKMTEAASAIQVITNEEIERSGARRLPQALRLATNLQVAQAGSHDWGITARGFNGFPVSNSSLANKLLVMIDGRTVYTPLFGGVFWDVQNVMLQDVEQIEVVSGPGGALWGANAVNGIINILSKSAKETQGWYASAAAGNFMQDQGTIRFGSHIDSTLYFRLYGQRMDFTNSKALDASDPDDSWHMNQGGFRMDYLPSSKNTFTLQGDIYSGEEDDTLSTLVNGQNILGKWTHSFTTHSAIVLQMYFDRTYRDIKRSGFRDELSTYDIDFQHNFPIGNRNKFVWGFGYRLADDDINSISNNYIPARRQIDLWSAFVQDRFQVIPERLELTVGSKVFQNDYTDVEFHPTIRLALMPNPRNTVWASASRAIRTPTRFEMDVVSGGLGTTDEFKSETVNAYEIGYRVRPVESLSFSISTFYNQYRDLRSLDSNTAPPPTFYFANNLESDAYGIELSANFIATSWWKLSVGYTYLDKTFEINSPNTVSYSADLEAIDPSHQFLVQSMMNVTRSFQVDGIIRYVSQLNGTFSTEPIPAYTTFDIRLAWNYKWVTLAVVGQNLAAPYHLEFGERKIPRSAYGKISVTF